MPVRSRNITKLVGLCQSSISCFGIDSWIPFTKGWFT